MEGFAIGWRDGILVLVVLAALYLVAMLLKLMQIGKFRQTGLRQEPDASSPETSEERARPAIDPISTPLEPLVEATASPADARAALAAYAEAMQEPPHEPFAVRPAPTFEWEDVKELFGEEVSEPASPTLQTTSGSPKASGNRGFGESLASHLARNDVEAEMLRMREEMEQMRREVENLRAARRVSPQYAEAMELSLRGLAAQDVADQLGISLAEAELVQALSRGKQNYEEGETDGAEGDAAISGRQRSRPAGRG